MKKVSVIIPAYNKAALTVQTVESVLNQTYPNIEVIVVDDGSTDNTREQLSIYGRRIRYVYKENGGACSARNLGIQLAQGEFIGFLDCDDLYVENKIALSVAYLKENPRFGFIHTAVHFIDDKNNIIGHRSHPESRREGWIAPRLIFGNYICNSTIVVRRPCLDKVGFFDESFFMPADWDLWLRLAESYQVGFLDKPLTQYRVSAHYILSNLEKSQEEEETVIEKYFLRHSNLPVTFKKRVVSNLHLRYALSHFLKQNVSRSKSEFSSSLNIDPFNTKALLLSAYSVVAPNHLRSRLAKKNGLKTK